MDPPLPPLSSSLETFLLSPENLPIHEPRIAQRIWPRKPKPESLYHVAVCPPHTRVAVERDLITGQLLGYHEEAVAGVGLTAQNSTSLQRAPDISTLSVKGDPTNYPFWPGGLQEMEIPKLAPDEDSQEQSVNFESDLLTIPPGFTEGVTFTQPGVQEEAPLQPSSSQPRPHVVSVAELLSGGGAQLNWFEVADEEEEEEGGAEGEEEARAEEKRGSGQRMDPAYDAASEASDTLENVLSIEEGEPLSSDTNEPAKEEWAVRVNMATPVDDFHQRVPNMALTWSFELDPFQKQAVLHLEQHNSVFVAAHTSAGKTVVAEYAIALSLTHLARTIYTSPIKALSNQKFREFRKSFGDDNVGLLTGDVQIRPEAPCLVMTTEILRSMLYNGSEVIRDVEWVIFDEVHYINDAERGVVWEEVLILLPDHVSIILLSATVPNAMEFADWVGRTKRKKLYVIYTLKRPVPLKHFLYTGNSKHTSDQLFEVVGEDKRFNVSGYKASLQAKKDRMSKAAASFGPKHREFSHFKEDKNIWLSLIHMLNKKEKLPVVAFTFSRDRCNSNADSLSSLDLTTGKEKSEIHVFFKKSISLLKGSDQQLPQVVWMRDILKRGIAVHHSGILPIIKEVIELLFQRGLVKLLFATETFAMGVNMPARTVVFDATRKHDGTRNRDLTPGEYVQMAGRAGRRGLDINGTVIILCKGDVPVDSDLRKMILGTPTTLESQFRLTYSMLLNLMRVETLRVEDMMKRSFKEVDSIRHEVDRKQTLDDLVQSVGTLEKLECPVCDDDIDHYYSACTRVRSLQRQMQSMMMSHPQVLKALQPGRVVTVYTHKHRHSLAVVLQQNLRKASRTFTTLMLCNEGEDDEEMVAAMVAVEQYEAVTPHEAMKELFRPVGVVSHAVVEVDARLVLDITAEMVSVQPTKIVEDYRRRQIPRFHDSPPAPVTAMAAQALLALAGKYPGGLKPLDPVKDLKMGNLDFVEMKQEKERFEGTLEHYSCIRCYQFKEHFELARKKAQLNDKLSSLKFKLSEASLQCLPEYHQRIEVLDRLDFISAKSGVISMKGRVACEIHLQEVLLTELMLQNVFADYEPEEIAALLSCVIFQQKRCSEPNLTPKLEKGKKVIEDVARDIARVEKQCGLDTSEEDFLGELRFGLTEVVYEWAKGTEFINIMELTDVSEGVIVRCIQRLDETCRDFRKAARVTGDPILYEKMQDASTKIKRGIVFAASLYTI